MPDSLSYASTTPRLGLPMLFTGQSQKEVTVNEALLAIDLLVGAVVEGVLGTPPADPAIGQMWIVGNTGSAAFSGHDGELAAWTEGGWRFFRPQTGLRVDDLSVNAQRIFDGTWALAASPAAPEGGANVDVEARACIVALLQALRTARIISQ